MIEIAIKELLTAALGFPVSAFRSEGKGIRAHYFEVSDVPELNVDGSVNPFTALRVQLDIWGPSYGEVKRVEKFAKTLHGYRGTVDDTKISLIKIDDSRPHWEPQESQYRITLDLIIYYDR